MDEWILKTAYLWGSLLLVPIWAVIYAKRENSRKEMLIMGTVFGIAAVLIARFYALNDYWNPPYIFGTNWNIEDFIYGFLFGGIAVEIYEALLGLDNKQKSDYSHYDFIPFFTSVTIFSFIFLVDEFKMNSIWDHILPPILVGLVTIIFRKDLFIPSVISGVIVTCIVIIWYSAILLIIPDIINLFWRTDKLIGFSIVKIPVEEILFAFAIGFGGANFYEFITGKVISKEITNAKRTDF